MIIKKSTKEEQRESLIGRIKSSFTKPRITYPSKETVYAISYFENELELLKEICKEQNLKFEPIDRKIWILPPTYEGYISK